MQLSKEIILKMIKDKVKEKEPNAEVVLYGSRARSDERSNSDWDILILSNMQKISRKIEREFRDELYDIELEIGEPISSFVFSKSEWESKHKLTPLYQNIKREGIALL